MTTKTTRADFWRLERAADLARLVREGGRVDLVATVLRRRAYFRGLTRRGRAAAPVLSALGAVLTSPSRVAAACRDAGLGLALLPMDALSLSIERNWRRKAWALRSDRPRHAEQLWRLGTERALSFALSDAAQRVASLLSLSRQPARKRAKKPTAARRGKGEKP